MCQAGPQCLAIPSPLVASRDALCAEALRWEGTPYHHEACLRGIGVDCVMLLVGVARACSLLPPTYRPAHYSPEWHLHQRRPALARGIFALGAPVLIPTESAQPGDIILMQFGRTDSHAGILLPGGQLIHAALSSRAVVRHPFTGDWRARWTMSFAFPGVGDVH